MAGGGFDSPELGGHRKKKKWQKGKRLGVRIDMTPMVDVILLLLTFFILTTTLNTPQIMQINLPKGEDDDKVKVDMANVLYIRVSGEGNIYFSQGRADGTELAPQNVALTGMRDEIEQRNAQNPNLLMLLKFDREMPYNLMVDILDEINRARTEGKRYTFMKMEETDREIVRLAGG